MVILYFINLKKKITLQIGDGKTISNTTNKLTISNFRKLDVKLNGQGAPLVPIGDIHLFSNYKYCLNSRRVCKYFNSRTNPILRLLIFAQLI